MTRTIFDPAAEAYDRLRPDYPAELYDAVERLSGVSLRAARVVEVGAGTGIATRQLLRRGAIVTAVDLSLAMLRRQQERSRCVAARGEQLPIGTGVADLVCSATAWHWVDLHHGTREATRVLRPGGALALWWNRGENQGEAWRIAYEESLARRGMDRSGRCDVGFELHHLDDYLRQTGLFAAVERHDMFWYRNISVDDYVVEISTHSNVIQLGAAAAEFLAEQRAAVAAACIDGTLRVTYRTHLHVARTPG